MADVTDDMDVLLEALRAWPDSACSVPASLDAADGALGAPSVVGPAATAAAAAAACWAPPIESMDPERCRRDDDRYFFSKYDLACDALGTRECLYEASWDGMQ